MSPLWPDLLQIELGAQELRLRRLSRGWRPRVLGEQRRVLNHASAETVGAALGDALQALPSRGAVAKVVLSGDWVRFALQTEAGALRGAAERQAAAAHALRRVYGDAAARWRVCSGEAGAGSLLAAGIDSALLDSLGQVLQGGGVRLLSVQPALNEAVNRCRRWLGRPSWLVSLEPGLLTLAFSDGQRLRSLRCHRLQRPLPEELPLRIEQARLIQGLGEVDSEVTVIYRGIAASEAKAAKPATRLVAADSGPAWA